MDSGRGDSDIKFKFTDFDIDNWVREEFLSGSHVIFGGNGSMFGSHLITKFFTNEVEVKKNVGVIVFGHNPDSYNRLKEGSVQNLFAEGQVLYTNDFNELKSFFSNLGRKREERVECVITSKFFAELPDREKKFIILFDDCYSELKEAPNLSFWRTFCSHVRSLNITPIYALRDVCCGGYIFRDSITTLFVVGRLNLSLFQLNYKSLLPENRLDSLFEIFRKRGSLSLPINREDCIFTDLYTTVTVHSTITRDTDTEQGDPIIELPWCKVPSELAEDAKKLGTMTVTNTCRHCGGKYLKRIE